MQRLYSCVLPPLPALAGMFSLRQGQGHHSGAVAPAFNQAGLGRARMHVEGVQWLNNATATANRRRQRPLSPPASQQHSRFTTARM